MIDSIKKSKLLWQARRGMLELDLILKSFLENSLDSLSENQINDLEELLSYDDPSLFEWVMNYSNPTKEKLKDLIELIQLHHPIR